MAEKDDTQPPAAGAQPQQMTKLAIDLGPLLIFFGVYLFAGIYWATGVLMAAMLVSLVVSRVVLGHISTTMIATSVLVFGFGAMTLWMQDPRFIKMKPTVINLLFAVVLLGGLALGKPFLKLLLGEALRLTDEGWRLLTWRWALFFVGLAILNELIWRNLSETTWASFKVFGILPLTMVFFVLQLGLIRRHSLDSIDTTDKTANK